MVLNERGDRKGNILDMNSGKQWLDLSLADVELAQADRIRVFRMLVMEGARLRGLLDRVLAPTGLTTQQGAMLSWIEAQPSAPMISAAAAALAMTHQNVKQIATALERKGFLEIRVDAQDRRMRRLALTERHHHFWQARNADDFAAVQSWLSIWTDPQVQQVLRLLRRLHRHLDQQGRPAAGG